jgi:hypothetical protein
VYKMEDSEPPLNKYEEQEDLASLENAIEDFE